MPFELPGSSMFQFNPATSPLGSAMSTASTISDLITQKLAQQKARAESPYWGPSAAGAAAQAQAQPALTQAQTQEAIAHAAYFKTQGDKMQRLLDMLGGRTSGTGGQQPGPSSTTGGTTGTTTSEPSYHYMFGIKIHDPTPLQMAQKNIVGTDTYSNQYDSETKQGQAEAEGMKARAEAAQADLKDRLDYNNLFNLYLNNKEQSWVTGFQPQLTAHLFGLSTLSPSAAAAQSNINDLKSRELAVGKELLGPGQRLTLPDTHTFLAQSPEMTWTHSQDHQKKALNDVGASLAIEKAQFYNSLRRNPNTPITGAMADQMFSDYKRDYPLIDSKGNIHPENLGHIDEYMTPEAIDSYGKFGKYTPPDVLQRQQSKGNAPTENNTPATTNQHQELYNALKQEQNKLRQKNERNKSSSDTLANTLRNSPEARNEGIAQYTLPRNASQGSSNETVHSNISVEDAKQQARESRKAKYKAQKLKGGS